MYIKKLYTATFRLIIAIVCIAVELFINACSKSGLVYKMDRDHKNIGASKIGQVKKTGHHLYVCQGNPRPIHDPCKAFFYTNIPCWYKKIQEGAMEEVGIKQEEQPGDHAVKLLQGYFNYTICSSLGTKRGECAECNITDYKCENDQYFLKDMKVVMQASATNSFNRFGQEAQRALVSRLDYLGNSLLFYAAFNNDYRVAKYLMQLGACPFYYGDKGMSPIEAARNHCNKNMEKLLLDPQYAANKQSCGICKHTVLDKKYSMETESYTEDVQPIFDSNSKLPKEVQPIAEYVSSSTSYPISEYVVRSSTQYNDDNNKRKSSFKLPAMPKRPKRRSAGAPAPPEERCPPPKIVLSIDSSSNDPGPNIGAPMAKTKYA